MLFNAVFNVILVISRGPVHLYVPSWDSFFQYSAQYSFSNPLAAFPHNYRLIDRLLWERNELCRNDYHQSSERIFGELGRAGRTNDFLISSPELCGLGFLSPFPNKPWFVYTSSRQVFRKHCGKRRNCS